MSQIIEVVPHQEAIDIEITEEKCILEQRVYGAAEAEIVAALPAIFGKAA